MPYSTVSNVGAVCSIVMYTRLEHAIVLVNDPKAHTLSRFFAKLFFPYHWKPSRAALLCQRHYSCSSRCRSGHSYLRLDPSSLLPLFPPQSLLWAPLDQQ